MSAPMGDVTWSVVSQVETVEQGVNSQIVRGVRITYKTSLGNSGSVFVPDSVYGNLDTVRQMLADAVKTSTTIQAMQG